MNAEKDVSLSIEKATQPDEEPTPFEDLFRPTYLFDGNDEIVRSVAENVDFEAETSDDLMELAMQLVVVAYKEGGYGAAAPQIGIAKRAFAIRPGVFSRAVEEFLNPVLTKHGKDVEIHEEGCLSLPGLVKEIARWKIVTLEWYDHRGKKHSQVFRGLQARIVQHELDHLDGILIDDERSGVTGDDLAGARLV